MLSHDELTLHFWIEDPAPGGDEGALNGAYVVQRAERGARFANPQRVKGALRSYGYVTGVSADGLSLFTAFGFETYVLIRSHASRLFSDFTLGITPARLVGWRAIPLAGCDRIVTTVSTGGCVGEDITYIDAIR